MQLARTRLVVDYGAAGVSALLEGPDGRWQPLMFDGQLVLSSAVAVTAEGVLLTGESAWRAGIADPDAFVAAPLAAAGEWLQLAGTTVETVGVIEATLRRVVKEAARAAGGPVTDVSMLVPASWGPRRRTWMRQAAAKAGMGELDLVVAPVTVVQHLIDRGRQIPIGAYLAVLDVGAGCEATVLRRNPSGLEVLSTLTDPTGGGSAIDEALAATLTAMIGAPERANRVVTLAAARAAKEAAGRQEMVTVAAGAAGAVVLSADLVRRVAWPALQRAADLTADAIKAAELDTAQMSAVLCVGGSTEMDLLGQALRDRVGVEPEKVLPPQTVALLGAAGIGRRPATTGPFASPAPAPARAWSMAVPGVVAIVLYAHFLYATHAENYAGYGKMLFSFFEVNWSQLALCSVATLIFTMSAAVPIAGILGASAGQEPEARRGGGVGAALLAAAAVGVALPALGAVLASALFEEPPGQWLRWAVLPALPTAAVAAVSAALATRWRRIPAQGWDRWLAFPHASIVLAGTAILLIAQVDVTFLSHGRTVRPVVYFAAGLMAGVAAILAALPASRYRWVFAALLGLCVALMIGQRDFRAIGVVYAIAVALWWARRAWQLMHSPLRQGPGKVVR